MNAAPAPADKAAPPHRELAMAAGEWRRQWLEYWPKTYDAWFVLQRQLNDAGWALARAAAEAATPETDPAADSAPDGAMFVGAWSRPPPPSALDRALADDLHIFSALLTRALGPPPMQAMLDACGYAYLDACVEAAFEPAPSLRAAAALNDYAKVLSQATAWSASAWRNVARAYQMVLQSWLASAARTAEETVIEQQLLPLKMANAVAAPTADEQSVAAYWRTVRKAWEESQRALARGVEPLVEASSSYFRTLSPGMRGARPATAANAATAYRTGGLPDEE